MILPLLLQYLKQIKFLKFKATKVDPGHDRNMIRPKKRTNITNDGFLPSPLTLENSRAPAISTRNMYSFSRLKKKCSIVPTLQFSMCLLHSLLNVLILLQHLNLGYFVLPEHWVALGKNDI